jgi:hypothetical protein
VDQEAEGRMTIGAKAHGEHANMGVVSLKTRGACSSQAGSGLPGANRNAKVTMTVAALVAKLQQMPQDLPVYIYDADEGGLLTLDENNVWFDKGDRNYPFPRVEVGGCYDERRVPMEKWCHKCAFPDSYGMHTCDANSHRAA